MKVEELEMLYAEFCLGTRATEEPSVTWGQRWREQAAILERHRRNCPTAWRNQPRRDEATLHPTPGTSISSKEDLYIYLCNSSGEGVRTEHTRNLGMKMAK